MSLGHAPHVPERLSPPPKVTHLHRNDKTKNGRKRPGMALFNGDQNHGVDDSIFGPLGPGRPGPDRRRGGA
jgi:hypothetical protein